MIEHIWLMRQHCQERTDERIPSPCNVDQRVDRQGRNVLKDNSFFRVSIGDDAPLGWIAALLRPVRLGGIVGRD